jgi:hypothetical protein
LRQESPGGEKKTVQKRDECLDKNAKPAERKYLLAAKPFFAAVGSRKYADATRYSPATTGRGCRSTSLRLLSGTQISSRNETYAMMNVTPGQVRLFDANACCSAFQETEMLRLTDHHSLIIYHSLRLGAVSSVVKRLVYTAADFLTLSRLALTRSTLGKSSNRRDLTFAQIMPEIFHQWIKRCEFAEAG